LWVFYYWCSSSSATLRTRIPYSWYAPHSRTQFRAKVGAMSSGSAPGGSGPSYAELKCMNDNTLDLLSDLCNVSVAAGLPPCVGVVHGNRIHDPQRNWGGCN
jgi:hypothetical protein